MQSFCAFQMLILAISESADSMNCKDIIKGQTLSKFFKFPIGFNSQDNPTPPVPLTLLPHLRVRH